MLQGEPYNSRDPELLERYHLARRLLSEYAQLDTRQLERRREILKTLLGRVGEEVWIEAPFYCDYGEQIYIGAHTFIHTGNTFLDSNEIHIGEHVLIGPGVHIYTAAHPVVAEKRIQPPATASAPYVTSSQPVQIGDESWIGGRSVILPGVRIGKQVTIGASSVVTRDIPDGVLAMGNPCRVVRELG